MRKKVMSDEAVKAYDERSWEDGTATGRVSVTIDYISGGSEGEFYEAAYGGNFPWYAGPYVAGRDITLLKRAVRLSLPHHTVTFTLTAAAKRRYRQAPV